jgi:tungstate transport system ATP-binding protein
MVSRLFPLKVESAEVRRGGRRILGPVDLVLENDGITVILGPNGAGKTTLLRALHGLERLTAGRVHCGLSEKDARKRQAYVFQTPIMLRRSVRRNLAYPLELAGATRLEICQKAEHWAERINLTEYLDIPAPRLSGGEKQKLALARALIRKPELLFLDEPCANLDGRSTREIEDLLGEALAGGTRIVMTTHDLGQARRLASDAIFLLAGRLHEAGPANSFFSAPKMQETRAFFRGEIIE